MWLTVVISLSLGIISAIFWYLEAKPGLKYIDNNTWNEMKLLLKVVIHISSIWKFKGLILDLLFTYILCTHFAANSTIGFIVSLGVSDALGAIIVWRMYSKNTPI